MNHACEPPHAGFRTSTALEPLHLATSGYEGAQECGISKTSGTPALDLPRLSIPSCDIYTGFKVPVKAN